CEGGCFAGPEDHATNAASGPAWVDKESPNFGSILPGIEQVIFTLRPAVTAKQRLAWAPAATACHHGLTALGLSFGNEISSVGDQLAVDAKHRFERAIDLGRRVIKCLQGADRGFDQCAQHRNIARDC